jgi:hypothetical protein
MNEHEALFTKKLFIYSLYNLNLNAVLDVSCFFCYSYILKDNLRRIKLR